MSGAARLLIHRAPGETRAVAFDARDRPFRLFLERWGGENSAARTGEIVSARLRGSEPGQGGSFFEIAGGEDVFVRTSDAGKLTEGAETRLKILSEARHGKLARGKVTKLLPTETGHALDRWIVGFEAETPIEETASPQDFDEVQRAFDEALAGECGLPGGGNLQIERTRALTAIDIDTAGRNAKGSAGARAFSINREAVSEAARQMSLRNLGGLVVIDCVSPVTASSGVKLQSGLQQGFSAYSGRKIEVLKPSAFGLLEAKLEWAEAPLSDRLLDADGLPTPQTELLDLFRAAAREALANRSIFYRLTLSARALSAYIARRKQCDMLLKETFSGRVSIASGKGEKSVVRRE